MGIRLGSSLLAIALLFSVDALACTTAIVSAGASADGRPMIWKQRDASNGFNTIAHIKGAKYSYTALLATQESSNKAYAGINEAGFAIANNLSYNLRPDSLGFNTRNGLLMAEALGSCASLEEFAALLDSREIPMHISSNFAVIDAYGGAAYFEVSDTAYVRYDVPEGGYLFRTNYSLSGDEDRGKGFARYITMEELMEKKGGKFDPAFFFRTGRSFINVLDGGNAMRFRRNDYIYSHDFIPRVSTTGAVVIVGADDESSADEGMMWCAPGYTPCSYAIPVWVKAGEALPTVVSGDAPGSRLAAELKALISPFEWKGGEKYLQVKPLRRIMRIVRRYERKELREGRKLARIFSRNGFDAALVEEYNAAAEARFESFKQRFNLN